MFSRVWTVFREFYKSFVSPHSSSLPLTTTTIVLFVSYLHTWKLAPSPISSYLSAVSYVYKMKDLRDPTKSFLTHKLLTVVGRERSPNCRLPITKPLQTSFPICALTPAYPLFGRTAYLIYRCVLITFYRFFRIGELVSKSPAFCNSVIQFNNLSFLSTDSCIQCHKITIRHFKHNTNKQLMDVITCDPTCTLPICPVQAMLDYCKVQ